MFFVATASIDGSQYVVGNVSNVSESITYASTSCYRGGLYIVTYILFSDLFVVVWRPVKVFDLFYKRLVRSMSGAIYYIIRKLYVQ